MPYPDSVMTIEDATPQVNNVYSMQSIPDENLDKKIFSNNMYKTGGVSLDNTANISTTDASNVNAANLNTSGVFNKRGSEIQDSNTLATVTKATSGTVKSVLLLNGAIEETVPEPED